jgi:hypothetical protein
MAEGFVHLLVGLFEALLDVLLGGAGRMVLSFFGCEPVLGGAFVAAIWADRGAIPGRTSTWNHKSVLLPILRDGHFAASSG